MHPLRVLTHYPIELPLSIVWSPPGPFNIEIDDLGMGFDSVDLVDDMLSASRKASDILEDEWKVGHDSRRIRLHGPTGEW